MNEPGTIITLVLLVSLGTFAVGITAMVASIRAGRKINRLLRGVPE